jgi:replicative DNA helicase
MREQIEKVILESLLSVEKFTRLAMPHLREDFFNSRIEKEIFKEIREFFDKHNRVPTKKILSLALDDNPRLKQDEFEQALSFVQDFSETPEDYDWLVASTEKFCKDKAIYLGIMKSIQILEGNDKELSKDAIPSVMTEALSVSFDKTIGHDYFTESGARFEMYHTKEDRIPFDLDMFNKITRGGLPRKTLNVILAGVNAGKSAFMCHCAASYIRQGFNVLYISMEMAESKIAERIDCNMMDIPIGDLYKMKRTAYEDKISELRMKNKGQLVIKEYPTASAHVGHFRALIEELKSKKDFKPDVIMIDYLNICASQRFKGGGNVNSYNYAKAIAEEIRGLFIETNVVGITATQLTRSGFASSDVEMTDTSESFGVPALADMLFALTRTEELDEMGQVLVKQLKSRYGDVNYYKRFVIGSEFQKFKFYDVDAVEQEDISGKGKTDDDKPLFDRSAFGKRMSGRGDTGGVDLDFS